MVHPSKRNLLAIAALLLAASSAASMLGTCAYPSGGEWPATFTYSGGEWYDSFGFDRNYYGGSDGYFPNLAYETLGENRELAYSIGEQFKGHYSSDSQRAEAILQFIQRWTEYGYDEDNVFMRGEPQPEWAWNADETAHMFNTTTGRVATGDCEDMAFLGATLYTAAGFDAALVLTEQHVALLIWLPEYDDANYYWDIPDDGRGAGWIWVEATGEENPLGWTPPDFNDGRWEAFPVAMMTISVSISPEEPEAQDEITVTSSVTTVDTTVSQVRLEYSLNGSAQPSKAMAREGSYYRATIPNQPKGTLVELIVVVTDTEGVESVSDEYSFTVGVPKSECIIATATYGSASAPQVQALRDFRDGIAMKTFAGSSFMSVFLGWYYSWSPPVAYSIAPDEGAKAVMAVVLQPILDILQVATFTYSALSFNGELAIVTAGFVAASLIGLAYVVPPATLAFITAKRLKRGLVLPSASKSLKYIAVPWVASIALIAAAEVALSPALMMAATAAFVVFTIILIAGAASLLLASLYRGRTPAPH